MNANASLLEYISQHNSVVASILLIVGFVTYFICFYLRLKSPHKLDCWFCQTVNYIDPNRTHWWRCDQCEQFNGFDQQGDYVKEIPAQFHHGYNIKIPLVDQYAFESQSNVLCKSCQTKQAIKINELAQFEPSESNNEAQMKSEIQDYIRAMEQQYALCMGCNIKVTNRINQCDSNVLPEYIDWCKNKATNKQFQKSHNYKRFALCAAYFILATFVTVGYVDMALNLQEKSGVSSWLLTWCRNNIWENSKLMTLISTVVVALHHSCYSCSYWPVQVLPSLLLSCIVTFIVHFPTINGHLTWRMVMLMKLSCALTSFGTILLTSLYHKNKAEKVACILSPKKFVEDSPQLPQSISPGLRNMSSTAYRVSKSYSTPTFPTVSNHYKQPYSDSCWDAARRNSQSKATMYHSTHGDDSWSGYSLNSGSSDVNPNTMNCSRVVRDVFLGAFLGSSLCFVCFHIFIPLIKEPVIHYLYEQFTISINRYFK